MKPNPCYSLGFFRTMRALSRVLPRVLCQALASGSGSVSYWLSDRARGALQQNLANATGGEFAPQRLCRRNFQQFCKMLADYFFATSATPQQIESLIAEWRGFEHIEAARKHGRGAIIVTAHLGNWELGGLLLALKDTPMTVVTLEEPTSKLTRWRENFRQQLGIKTITVGPANKFAFVEMIQTLRRGEFLAMLVDRPYRGSGSKVRFFGRDTEFSTGPAMLWQHTQADVLPAFVVQRRDGRYLSFVDPPLPFTTGVNPAQALGENTQTLATAFESIIRSHLDQWYNYVPLFPPAPEPLPHSIPASSHA